MGTLFLLIMFAFTATALFAAANCSIPESPAPQPQDTLPQMLEFTWSAGPHMPQGLQDNDGGIIDNHLVMACGFCSGFEVGGPPYFKPDMYPRGFFNKVWALDLANEERGWISLPDFPGVPRQELMGVAVKNEVYLWGGFSYGDPFTHDDGYKLSHKNGEWTWSDLPPLPWPNSTAACCAIGSNIYIFGGTDYNGKGYTTSTDRTGTVERMGARLIAFDTEHPEDGWKDLPTCPGTPRNQGGMAAVDGKLYVIGGNVSDPEGDFIVVDSWRFDAKTETWDRLRDLPVSVGGFSYGEIVYAGRYMLLAAGYQRPEVMNPDGSRRPKYGTPSIIDRTGWKLHPGMKDTHYYNHFWVYDTKTNLYGTATKLPYDDHMPPTHVIGDTVYLFADETGGFVWEGEFFGHQPEFVLKGKIKELPWER